MSGAGAAAGAAAVAQAIKASGAIAFYTSPGDKIFLPNTCEVVEAKRIWLPS